MALLPRSIGPILQWLGCFFIWHETQRRIFLLQPIRQGDLFTTQRPLTRQLSFGFVAISKPPETNDCFSGPTKFSRWIDPPRDADDPDTVPEFHVKPTGPKWASSPTLHVIPCYWHLLSNLPALLATVAGSVDTQREILTSALELTDKANLNLSDSQKALLMLHYKLGHLGFKHIQWLSHRQDYRSQLQTCSGL
jgi:hypothetical protein